MTDDLSILFTDWQNQLENVDLTTRPASVRPVLAGISDTYRNRLDSGDRISLQTLLAARPTLAERWVSAIKIMFDRYLQTFDRDDLDIALVLTAIYDRPSQGRDFLRMIYPVRVQMGAHGIDAGRIFDEAVALTTPHEDPDVGAFCLFTTLGRRWDEPRLPPLKSPAELDGLLRDWGVRMDELEVDPDGSFPDTFSLALDMAEYFRNRLNDQNRQRARLLLAEHPRLVSSWTSVIARVLSHYIRFHLPGDINLAITLIAVADTGLENLEIAELLRRSKRDMPLHPHRMDPSSTFTAASSLTVRHDDPTRGAFGLFAGLARV